MLYDSVLPQDLKGVSSIPDIKHNPKPLNLPNVNFRLPPLSAADSTITPNSTLADKVANNIRKTEVDSTTKSLYQTNQKTENLFEKEGIKYNPYIHGQQELAEVQGVGTQFWNAAKIAAKDAWGLWTSHMQTAGGIKPAIQEGSFKQLWDNDDMKDFAEFSANLREANPIHLTEWEQKHPVIGAFSSGNLASTISNAGFTIGTIANIATDEVIFTLAGAAIGAVYGEGIGAIPGAIAGSAAGIVKGGLTAARTFKMANQLAKVYTIPGKAKELAALVRSGKALGNAIRTTATLSNVGKAGKYAFTIGLAANTEAAIEAHSTYNETLESLKEDYLETNGVHATGRELDRLVASADSAKNWTYGLNLPLLSISNYTQFKNLIVGRPFSTPISSFIKREGQDVVSNFTLKSFLKERGKDVLKSMVVEGSEELGQHLIAKGTSDYFSRAYKGDRQSLGEVIAGGFQHAVSDEGLRNLMAGIMMGGGTSIISTGYGQLKLGTFKDRASDTTKKQVDAQVEYLNKFSNLFDNTVRSNYNESLREQAKDKDSVAYSEAIHDNLFDFVTSGMDAGKYEVREDYINELKGLDLNEFNQLTGINAQNTVEQHSWINQILKDASTIRKNYETVNSAYSVNPFEEEHWFKKLFNRTPDVQSRVLKAQLWNGIKKNIAHTISLTNHLNGELNSLVSNTDIRGDYLDALSTGLDSYVTLLKRKQVKLNEQREVLPSLNEEYNQVSKLVDKINSANDPNQFLNEILDFHGVTPQKYSETIDNINAIIDLRTKLEQLNKNLTTVSNPRNLQKVVQQQASQLSTLQEQIQTQVDVINPPVIPIVPVTSAAPAVPISQTVSKISNQSNYELYLQENTLDAFEQNILKALVDNKTIKIECA